MMVLIIYKYIFNLIDCTIIIINLIDCTIIIIL